MKYDMHTERCEAETSSVNAIEQETETVMQQETQQKSFAASRAATNMALILILAMIAAGIYSIVLNLQAITSGPK